MAYGNEWGQRAQGGMGLHNSALITLMTTQLTSGQGDTYKRLCYTIWTPFTSSGKEYMTRQIHL